MKFSILIPHYKSKITAYAISELFKYKGRHEIDIFVVNNNVGDGSEKYLLPFMGGINYIKYPKDRLQSHGCSFDYILPQIKTEWFITIESDSFPAKDNWLDYYENLILQGIDCAGSILELSGGCYLHPCGALYKKTIWEEAKTYCDNIPYQYFPNMSRKEGFDCHLMVHNDIAERFLDNPDDYIVLSESYKPYSKGMALERLKNYRSIKNPFHNGMGGNEESIKTYRQRTFNTEIPTLLLDGKRKLLNRIGNEPGQWLSYYHFATNKKVFSIPTEIKWLPNRERQQQEYTINEAEFCHLWAGSSFLDMKDGKMNDVYEFKKKQIDDLYNSLPENQKIK